MQDTQTFIESLLQDDQNRKFPLPPYSGKRLGGLFGAIFGVSPGAKSPVFPPEFERIITEAVDQVFATLTPREEQVLRMRLGLNTKQQQYTQQAVADHFAATRFRIRQIENKAFRKLRHPVRARGLKVFLETPEAELRRFLQQRSSPQRLAELVPVIEKIRRLEPALIRHLQQHNDDLDKIHPLLFEHLFAEFLAAQEFEDVRLVGRNPKTSADIFATKFIPGPDIPMRVFVEVKRWKDTIGVEVINQVLGAFLGERERFGWNAALVVTVGGFRDFEKWSREELTLKNVHLNDRTDLLRYLDGYKQHANGLWLPNPRTDL
jgi:DNA-binding CsgD family transcriptional regulator